MSRHIARVRLSMSFLRQILQFPESFDVVNGYWDFTTDIMTLVVESSQLYEVPEGEVVPHIEGVTRRDDDGRVLVEWPVASD